MYKHFIVRNNWQNIFQYNHPPTIIIKFKDMITHRVFFQFNAGAVRMRKNGLTLLILNYMSTWSLLATFPLTTLNLHRLYRRFSDAFVPLRRLNKHWVKSGSHIKISGGKIINSVGIDVSKEKSMESFFATLKKEKFYQIPTYKMSKEEDKTVIYRYIFGYYNTILVNSFNPGGWPPSVYKKMYEREIAA